MTPRIAASSRTVLPVSVTSRRTKRGPCASGAPPSGSGGGGGTGIVKLDGGGGVGRTGGSSGEGRPRVSGITAASGRASPRSIVWTLETPGAPISAPIAPKAGRSQIVNPAAQENP